MGAVDGGTLDVYGSVAGTGILMVVDPSTLRLAGPVSATQTVDMSGAGAALILDDPRAFAGEIEGFGAGQTVEISGGSGANSNWIILEGSGGAVEFAGGQAVVVGGDNAIQFDQFNVGGQRGVHRKHQHK